MIIIFNNYFEQFVFHANIENNSQFRVFGHLQQKKKNPPPINALKKHAQIIKITQLNMTV